VNPVNLYGATKLCSDKLFIAANSYTGGHKTRFSIVRYGNVVGSRGSVVPLYLRCKAEGRSYPVTSPNMTRFYITLPQAVQFVLDRLTDMSGGEVFVPKIPSMNIMDLKHAIDPNGSVEFIGIRPGEKLHELLISPDEPYVREFDNYYAVLNAPAADSLPHNLQYRSDTNPQKLSSEDLELAINFDQIPSIV